MSQWKDNTKGFLLFMFCVVLLACKEQINNKTKNHDTSATISQKAIVKSDTIIKSQKPIVMILPPYDEIANKGISPDIRSALEDELIKNKNVTVFRLPFKNFSGGHFRVYDKKYCESIVDKIDADILIMTKIDPAKISGNMKTDKWNFTTRIYFVKSDIQVDSGFKGDGVSTFGFIEYVHRHIEILVHDIVQNQVN